MSRVPVVLLALAALLAAVLWYVTSTRAPSLAEAAAAADVVGPAVAADAPAASLVGTPVQERDEEREARSARELAPTARDEQLSRAHWVEGRVVFPADTPGDEEAWVVADGRDFEDGSDHRVRVEPDGSFRVAFSERSREGEIVLRARYLLLKAPVGWSVDAEPREVVLEPVLGGRLVVRAQHSGGPAPAGEVGLVIMRTRNSWMHGNERLPFDADGLAAFDALEADTEVRPIYAGPELVGEAEAEAVVVERGVTVEAMLRLEPGVVLGGRVVDGAGEPIAGASVEAFTHGVMASRRSIESAVDGAFRADALPPGRIRLRVQHDGYETFALDLVLERGERRTDLALVLSRGGTIAGVVRWPDGRPAEAELVLEPADTEDLSQEQMQPVEGEALEDGSFRISGLSASAYLVRARATSQQVEWSARADAVDVGTEDVALVLGRGGSVSGVVVDDRGALVADFRVVGWRPSSELAGIRLEGDVSRELEAAGGAFSFEDLEPGAWRFAAIGSEHASSEVLVVDVPTTQRVELRTPRAAGVRGVVLDAAGEPCPQVTLSVERPGSHGFAPYDLAQGWTPVTDADGAFVLAPLRPGPVVLSGEDRRRSTTEPLALDLEPGVELRDVVLRLRAGASIVVEVVGRDGRPVEGALVQVFPSGRARTDASGSVELARLAPGRSHVQAEVDGIRLQQTVDLIAGETVRARLALPTTAPVRLRGRATVDGAPLRGGSLWASPYGPPGEPGVGTSSATTEADGSYVLTVPAAGEYAVSLSRHDGTGSFSQRFQVVVPPVAEHALDLAVVLGRIAGAVADASGTPLSGVQLRAVSQGPGFTGAGLAAGGQAHARTGTDGTYELALPAGTYVVAAGGQQWSTNGTPQFVEQRSSPIDVAAGGLVRGVDFVLRPGAALEGRVRTADGSRFEGATVCSGDRPLTWAQADGLFRVDALEPGVHWVRAFSSDRTTAEPVRVEVGLDEPARVELVLVPSTYVAIRVRDASGGKVVGTVTVLDADGRPLPLLPTNDGVVAGLTPGTYTARATAGEATASRELEVKEGEGLEVEIVVQ